MKTLRKHRQLLGWFMTCLMALWLPGPARGATFTWNQAGAGPFAWNTNANWLPATGFPNATDDIALLNAINLTANQTINLTAGITVGQLSIGDLLGASTYTLAAGGGSLTFDVSSGNALLLKTGGGTDNITAGFSTLDNLNINVLTGSTLAVDGAITDNGNTITKLGGGTLTIGPAAGVNNTGLAGNLVLVGGTLTANAGTGATPNTLGTATVKLQGGNFTYSSTLAAAGNANEGNNILVERDAFMQINGSVAGTNVQFGNLGIGNQNLGYSATNASVQFTGTTTLSGTNARFLANNTMRFGAIDDGAGVSSITQVNGGTLRLGSASTFEGGVNILRGIVQADVSGATGVGNVIVNPGGRFEVLTSAAIPGTNGSGVILSSGINSTPGGFGVIGLAADTAHGNLTGVQKGPFGGVLGINTATFTAAIDMSTVGNDMALGAFQNTTVSSTSIGAAANGILRLGTNSAAGTTLTLTGANAIDSASTGVVMGTPLRRAIAATTFTDGTVQMQAAQDYATPTTIFTGNTVNVNATTGTNPLGTGTVNVFGTLDTGAVNYTPAGPQLGNGTINIYGGSVVLSNNAVALTSTNNRLATTADINMIGGTFSYRGINTVAHSQTVDQFNTYGQATVDLQRSAAAGAGLTTLTLGNLVRNNNSIVAFTTTNVAALGGAEGRIVLSQLNGGAVTPVNGMLPAYLINGTANSFVTHAGGTGLANATLVSRNNATFNSGGLNNGTELIDQITTAVTSVASGDVYALRLGVNITDAANTFRIRSGGLIANAGTPTINAATYFGDGATPVEAIIYNTVTTTFSNALTAAGLTKGGAGTLALAPAAAINGGMGYAGTGTGALTGAINLQAGTLQLGQQYAGGGTTTNPYAAGQNVNVWGGIFQPNAAVYFQNDVVFKNSATLGANNANAMIRSLAVDALPVAVTGVEDTATSKGLVLTTATQQTHVHGNLTMNGDGVLVLGTNLVIGAGASGGGLSGAGRIDKYGTGILNILGDSSGYSGAVTIYQGAIQSNDARTGSDPFGTGNLTVMPGAIVRIANANNFGAGTNTIHSDRAGLGVLALAYGGNASLPTVTFNKNNGPFDGVVAIDVVGFTGAIDQNTIGTGLSFLGSTLGGNYQGATLAPGAGSTYRLGGGGSTLNINTSVLTGANAVHIGAVSNDLAGASISLVQGTGTISLNNTQAHTGGTRINGGATLQIGVAGALNGTGALTFNGATLNPGAATFNATIQPSGQLGLAALNATATVNNNIDLIGDLSAASNGANDLILSGNVSLGANLTGVSRAFNITTASGRVYFSGNITDGTGGSGNQLVKTGTGVMHMTGTNSYTGNTYILGGTVALTNATDIPTSSPYIFLQGGGNIGVFEQSLTMTNRDLVVLTNGAAPFYATADGGVNVGPGLTLTMSGGTISGAAAFIKSGQGTTVLSNTTTNAASFVYANGGVLQFNSRAASGDQSVSTVANTLGSGGTYRFNFSASTATDGYNRPIGAGTGNAGVDVTTGNTVFFMNGFGNNGGANLINFTGAGTAIYNTATATTNVRGFNLMNGELRYNNPAATSIPWDSGNNTTPINTFGGTLNLNMQAAAAWTMTVPANAAAIWNLTAGGGGRVLFTPNGANAVTITDGPTGFFRVARQNQGTLLFQTATGDLGVAAAGAAGGRIIPENINLNGTATTPSATAVATSGAFIPALLKQSASGGDFLAWNATNGLTPFASYAPNFTGSTVNTVANITTDPAFAAGAVTRAFGFKTTSDISGGTIRITSVGNTTASGKTEIGGILINGSNTISSNLLFDPAATGITQTTPTVAAGSGEGLIYVAPLQNATVSGNIMAQALTKFGDGQLTLSAENDIINGLFVQSGTLRFVSGGGLTDGTTDLFIANQGVVDLNGQNIHFDSISNGSATIAGGRVTGSAGSRLTLNGGATQPNTAYFGQIDGSVKLVRMGSTGNTVLGDFTNLFPEAGNNSFTGGTEIYGGTLQIRNPYNLGGYNGASVGSLDLYGGAFQVRMNGGNNNGTVIIGDQATSGITVNVRGNTTFDVANNGANSGNKIQIGNLNLGMATLGFTTANTYILKAAGTTAVQGTWADILSNSNGPGNIEIAGPLTGSGILYKRSTGTTFADMRALVISGTSNTGFNGNIVVTNNSGASNLGNVLQITGNSGDPIGTGMVTVMPTANLRVAGNSSLGGGTLKINSQVNQAAMVSLDNSFNPTFLTATNFSSKYTHILGISTPFFNTAINMSTIGDGKAFLGNGYNNEAGITSVISPGVADDFVASQSVWRVTGNASTNLAFVGSDNQLTGAHFLQVGPIANNLVGTVAGTGGSVVFRQANNFSGGTQIVRGLNVFLDAGAFNASPLGTGDVEVYGSIQTGSPGGFGGVGSFVNATGDNYFNVNLRPGGVIQINDVAGDVLGGEGRWDDAGALSLNGGTFIFNQGNASAATTGANNTVSYEKIGAVTAGKGGTLRVLRQATSGSAILEAASLSRGTSTDLGTLQMTFGVGSVGTGTAATSSIGAINPASTVSPTNYLRVLVTGGVSTAGTTVNGSQVTSGGIAAPWIVDASAGSFVGYNPMAGAWGGDTGFQSVLSTESAANGAAATPGLGQIGYSHVYFQASGAIAADPGAGSVIDIKTAGQTLNVNINTYAMRISQNLNIGTGNTITFAGGDTSFGGILFNGNATIAPQVANALVPQSTIAFGAREAVIFTGSGNTGVINSQITGTGGLTKFGAGQLTLAGSNSGLTGQITVNGGTLLLNTPVSGTGTATASPVNGQTIVLNGNSSGDGSGQAGTTTLNLDGLVSPTSNRNSVLATGSRVTTTLNSNIQLRGDAVIGNPNSAVQQNIASLTFADLGPRSPIQANFSSAGITVTGATILGANSNAMNSAFGTNGRTIFNGVVSGGADGRLIKTGNGFVEFNNTGNTFGTDGKIGLEVWSSTPDTATSIVGSLVRSGTPFGVGDINVLPGAALRVIDTSNITSQKVNIFSDGVGLGGLDIAFNATNAQIASMISATPTDGKASFTSTGPYTGVISLSQNWQTKALDLAALETAAGGGSAKFFLGSTVAVNYFNQNLTPGSGGVYRIGGGGNQGTTIFGVNTFENVFTSTNSIQFGAPQFENGGGLSQMLINGNNGNITLRNRNDYSGGSTLYRGTIVIGETSQSFGTGTITTHHLAGTTGYLRLTNGLVIANNFDVVGDLRLDVSGNDAMITGNVNLAPGGVAGTHVIETNSGSSAQDLAIRGIISGAGSSLVKAGGQYLVLSGANTYSGQTTVTGGLLAIANNVLPLTNGPLGNSDSPVIVTGNGTAFVLGGAVTMGRDLYLQPPNTAGNTSIVQGQSLYNATVSGAIVAGAGTANGIPIIRAINGGTLDITGPISSPTGTTGEGIRFGDTATTATHAGAVRLLANTNGISPNTYAQGTFLDNTRLYIGADSYWTGTTAAPQIISGPFGTGTLLFGSGSNNGGTNIGGLGGSYTIPNALGSIGTGATLNTVFEGRGSLNFNNSSAWNFQSSTTLRTRQFTINTQQGSVTFGGALTADATVGGLFEKRGPGILFYTGTPSAEASVDLATDGNYGTLFQIQAGTFSVTNDLSLGSNALASAGSKSGLAADVQLTGGTLGITGAGFSTAKLFRITASSGIDVASGGTLTSTTAATLLGVAANTAVIITKSGAGTLALNPATNGSNLFTGLTIGGLNGGGGTVTTTNTAGLPFGSANGTSVPAIILNGGTLSLTNATTAQTINNGATSTLTYQGGGYISIVKPTTGTNSLQVQTLTQTAKGTLVLTGTDTTTAGAFGTATGTQKFILGGALPTIANGTLATPSVVLRNLAANSDANFVTAIATHGFQIHAGTEQATLATSTTNIGAIVAASLTTAAAADIYALKTTANIDATTAGDTLRINNGGLLFNGNTAPVIGGNGTQMNLRFGTAGALTDAYVYVREGQTGTSTITANINANDFIKYGPGTLLINAGTGSNVLTPGTATGTNIRSVYVHEGILRFASTGAAFSAGSNTLNTADGKVVNYVVNDTGTLDLFGQTISMAGLSGAGTVNNTTGTGTLTINVGLNNNQTFTGILGGGSSNNSFNLIKSGVGTQTLATPVTIGSTVGANTFTGAVTINAGQVLSATGTAPSSNGTLVVSNPLGLGNPSSINLAGGILSVTNNTNIDFINGQNGSVFGPGNGYNITIAANNNFGTANTTSTLNGPFTTNQTTNSNAAFINNLTVNAPAFSFSGGSVAAQAGGVQVTGTSTFAGNTTINSGTGSGSFIGQVNAPGYTLTKVGTGSLYFSNQSTTSANTVGAWIVGAGTLEARGAAGGGNPFGSTSVTVNGANVNTRFDGDGTEAPELITTAQATNFTIGSTAALSSLSYIGSRNVQVDNQRLGGQAGNKTVVLGNLTFGGPLGASFITTSSNNNNSGYRSEYGSITMLRTGLISTNGDTTVTGAVTGMAGPQSQGGTLFRQSAQQSIFFNADSSANWKGGYVNASGTTFFGTFEAGAFNIALSNTAKLGTGNVLIQPGSAIQYNSSGNVPTGWTGTTQLYSHLSDYGILRIAGDSPLTTFNTRIASLGGPQDFTRNVFSTTLNNAGFARNAGSAIIAVNTVYTQNLDLAKIGDGTAWLGSTSNGQNQFGTYNGSSLGIGANNTYRLGVGGSTLYFGTNGNTNVLTDVDLGALGNVTVGTPNMFSRSDSIGGGNGRGAIILLTDQNYTGATTVNRLATLEFRGALKSTSFENWWLLTAGGEGGTFVNAGGTANIGTVTNRPGSELRFDYNTGLLPAGNTQGRWHDSADITLNNSMLRLIGNRATEINETVGTVTVNGGGEIRVQRDAGARMVSLTLGGLTRGTNGVLNLRPANAGLLGSDERVYLSGGVGAIPGGITNGMVAPWIANMADASFLTYTTENGFVNAGSDLNIAANVTANTGAGTERVNVTGASAISNATTLDVYALRMGSDITAATPGTASGATVKVRSGGIIFDGTGRTLAPNVIDANGGELILWAAGATSVIGDAANVTTTGQIQNATKIIKFGDGILDFRGDQQTFTGDVVVAGGAITLRSTASTGTPSVGLATNGGNIVMNAAISHNVQTAPTIFLRSGTASITYKNGITIGQNNQFMLLNMDRDGTAVTGSSMTLTGGLNFLGSPGESGQIFRVTNGNSFNNLIINGSVDLGPAGNIASFNPDQTITINGKVGSSGGSAILALRGNTLDLANLTNGANDWSGGSHVYAGTLTIRGSLTSSGTFGSTQALTQGGAGSGSIYMNTGTLNIRVDASGANRELVSVGNTASSDSLYVLGSSTVTVDRQSANSNKHISFKDLTIGSSVLTVTGGNTYAFDVRGATNLTGYATFNNNTTAEIVLNGAVSDGGAGYNIFKTSTGQLFFNSTSNSFGTAGRESVIVNGGTVRFGDLSLGLNGLGGNATTATAGQGIIRLNPGTSIHLESSANVAAGNLRVVGSGPAISVVGLRNTANFGQFTDTYLQGLFTSDSTGVIAIESAGTLANNLNLANYGNGTFYLGAGNLNSVTANGTYSGTSLGVGANSLYRIGGGGGTLTMDSAATTTGVLTGGNGVIFGSQAIAGQIAAGTGTVQINDLNDYTGATTINRGSTVQFQTASAAAANGPLGASSQLDVFGTLRAFGTGTGTTGTFLNSAGTANQVASTILHPGSILQLDNSAVATATMTNRWGDGNAIALNSSMLLVNGPNLTGNLAAVETVGAFSFAGGSTVSLQRTNTNFQVAVTTPSVTRTGDASLIFVTQGAGQLGIAAGNNSSRFVVSGGVGSITGGDTVAVNTMLPGYYVNATDNTFLTYGANGFANIATFTNTFSAGAPNAWTTGLTAGTERVSVTTTNSTLLDNPSIFALRTDRNIDSGTGQYNTITFLPSTATSAEMGGIIFAGNNPTLNVNLRFGSSGNREAYLFTANNNTATINGDISASKVVKSGTGILAIGKDQTDAARGTGNGYSGNWIINQGQLNLGTLGAAGNGGTIVLAGGTGNNTQAAQGQITNAVTLNLGVDVGSVLKNDYTFGGIQVKDLGIINATPGGDDRTIGFTGNFEINSSDTTGLVPARARVAFASNRSILSVNGNLVVSGTGSSIIDLNAGAGGLVAGINGNVGVSTGMIVNQLSNASGGASLGLVKWGNGTLYVRNDAATMNGNISIEQGALSVMSNDALGSGITTVKRYGVLQIDKNNFAPTVGSIVYEAGGAERWNWDGARTGQSINLGGASLQVGADQFTAVGTTVTLNGGTIEGWIRSDDQGRLANGAYAEFRTLGSGVSVTLAGNSFVGQNITESAGGIDAGVLPNVQTPTGNTLTGAILDIQGVISGGFSLTKQGFDVVTLSGANTYSGGTTVAQGTLRIGANNALLNTGDLQTTGQGVFDLNGFNQTVRQLTSNTVTTPGFNSGFITNSSTETRTLTVGNSSTGSMVYSGVIQNNVALTLNTSAAGHVLKLNNANTYIGGTTLTQGWLEAANTTGSATGSGLVTVNGGTLSGAGLITGRAVLNGGGTIQPGAVTAGPVSSGGVLSLGSLTINGGSLVFGLTTPGSTTDDMIQITGWDPSASLKALQLDGALSSLTINDLGGFTTGTYTLINYNVANATLGGSFATAFGSVLNPSSPNPAYFLTVVNNTAGKTIDLLVQSNTTALWTGAEDQKWNLLTHTAPKNWKNLGGTPSDFSNGLDVTFDDTATGFAPQIDGIVKPLSVVFNNSTTYTLGQANGAGDKISNNSINSQTGDTDGSTNVITNVASTTGYTVGMTINGAGIPTNSVITAVGATTITINNNTTAANTGATLTGTTVPTLTKNGAGVVVLNTPDNDFSGGATLNAGTIRLGANTTVTGGSLISGPLGTGTVTLNGGTLQDDGSTRNVANSVILGGNVTFSSTGSGSIVFTNEVTTPSASTTTISNPSANTTLTVNNTTEFQQVISGTGKALTKAGSGTLTFTAANTYNGGTTVSAGTLAVTSTGSLASGSNLTVGASGTANFAQLAQTLGTLSNTGITNLNGAASQALTVTTLTGTGDLNLGSNVGTTLTAANGTYSGTIDQTGALVKNGGGADTLTLSSGASTFSGGTTLNANSGTLGLGASSTVSGGVVTQGPIGTGDLTIAGGNTINGVTADQSIHNNVALNGNVNFGGTDLTFDDAGLTTPSKITLGINNPTITVGGGVITTFSQVVNDGASTFGFTKAGAGTLVLNEMDNTYTGVTTISAGTLRLISLETGSADSLGDSTNAAGNVVFSGGGTLQYVGSGSTSDRLFTINSGVTGTLDASGTGTLIMNNTGAVGGTGNRNIVLTGNNNTDNTLSAQLALAAGTLTKSGTGTWLLNSATSNFTGATTITAGTLKITNVANGGSASSIGSATNVATNLVISSGSTLQWVGSTNQSTDRLFRVTANGTLDASGTGGSVVNFTNSGTITTGTTDASTTLTLAGTGGTATTPNTLAGLIADNGNGDTTVVKSGTGAWHLTNAASTYDGTTTINAGTLVVTKLSNGGAASSIGDSPLAAPNLVIGSTGTPATLRYVGATDTTDRLFTLNTGGGTIDASGTGAITFSNTGTATLSGTNTARTLTLSGTNTADNTLNPVIANNGTGATAITKSGDGTWVLGSANTYTGATTINDGTLKSGVNNAINSGSSVIVSATNTSDSVTWNLQTFNQTSSNATMAITMGGNTSSTSIITGSGTSTLTLGGNVTYDATNNPGAATISVPTVALGTAARTFTVGDSTNAAADMTVTSVITGGAGGAITKAGAGTLVLNNATNSTYTGATLVNGGTLQVGVATVGTTGTGAVTVAATGTLAGTGTVLSTATSTIQSGGALAPGDTGGTIVGTLTFSNSLTLAAGSNTTLQITTPNTLSAGDLDTVANLLAAGTYTGISAAIGANLSNYNTGLGAGSHDLLKSATGTITATSGSTITVADLNYLSGTPAIGHIFNLIDWAAFSFGTFNAGTNFRSGGAGGGDLVLPTLGGELGWDVSAFTTTGVIVVVPEPSRALFLMLGLLGLMLRRRRKAL